MKSSPSRTARGIRFDIVGADARALSVGSCAAAQTVVEGWGLGAGRGRGGRGGRAGAVALAVSAAPGDAITAGVCMATPAATGRRRAGRSTAPGDTGDPG